VVVSLTSSGVSRMLALHEQGLPSAGIARELGVSQTCVSRRLRYEGITGANFSFCKELSCAQESVILGSLLGDGCMVRTPSGAYMKMDHGISQSEYLVWKSEMLAPLYKSIVPKIVVRKGEDSSVVTKTRVHPLLIPYYDMFYSRPVSEMARSIGRKRLTTQILNSVNDLALAVWFGDDGTCIRHSRQKHSYRDGLELCLGGLGSPEYGLVEDWFGRQGFCVSRRGEGYLRKRGVNAVNLYFTVSSSVRLAAIIGPFLPKCMHYKLGNTLR